MFLLRCRCDQFFFSPKEWLPVGVLFMTTYVMESENEGDDFNWQTE